MRSAIAKVERFVPPPELRASVLRAVRNRSTSLTSWRWRTTGALAASYAGVTILGGSIAYLVAGMHLQRDFAVQEVVAALCRASKPNSSRALRCRPPPKFLTRR